MPSTPVFEVHGDLSDEVFDALARLLLSIAEQEEEQPLDEERCTSTEGGK